MKKEEDLNLYHQMVTIRRLEEKAASLYQLGKIGGFLHLYIGQEAVSTGLISVRTPQDRVITAYRDHGVALNCGLSPREIIAELLGKVTGCSQGRGGSMHMADVTKNYWGGHAIVGAHLPIATGLALADLYKGNKAVTICMFGDGSSNIGYFHEALNLSKVWKLPMLWVCENNQYGMGTAIDRASAVSEMRRKADGYGMKNEEVDGMNLMAMRETSARLLEEIRGGSGPQFLEAMTYRFRGHSMGDPERYRKQEEVLCWEESDPLGIFSKYLLDNKLVKKKDLEEQIRIAEADIEDAVAFAEASPDPAPEDLFKNIYVEE